MEYQASTFTEFAESNATRADVEEAGGFGLGDARDSKMQIGNSGIGKFKTSIIGSGANLQICRFANMLIRAIPTPRHIRQLRRHHRPPTNSNSSSNPTQRKLNAVDPATQRNSNAHDPGPEPGFLWAAG